MIKLLDEEVRCSVLIRAEPEKVYDAFATAEGLDGWFTHGSTVDARPGGKVTFRWKDWGPESYDGDDGGPVLEAERPRRFVFQWQTDNPSYYTTVEFDVEPHEKGTVVHCREHGFKDSPGGRRKLLENASGWGEALALWKFYVEHGLRY